MLMIITNKTRVKDITPFITTQEKMLEAIDLFPEYPLQKDILQMTCGEFCELCINEEDYLSKIMKPRERAYKAFGRLKSYRNQMNNLSNYLKTFDISLTPEEQAAGKGVDFPTTPERILLDCVKTFHLHSTKEAENLPLTDWIIVLKDQVASAKYQRNYNKILEQKSKTQRK